MERLQILRSGEFVNAEIKDIKSGDRFRVVESGYVGKERVADGDAYQEPNGHWAVKVR